MTAQDSEVLVLLEEMIDLNCHLEYSKKKGEKKIGFTFGIIVSKNVKVHNGTSTYICQEELL